MTISDPRALDGLLEAMAVNNADWIKVANRLLEDYCYRQAIVTTDDLWLHLAWPGNGRIMGKVIRSGITRRWITKWEIHGRLQTYDHVGLNGVTSLDGHVVSHQGPLVIYRSLLFTPPDPDHPSAPGPSPSVDDWHPFVAPVPRSTP